MKAEFNALDKDSSAGYSKSVIIKDLSQLHKAILEFTDEVPFTRFYIEVTSDSKELPRVAKKLLDPPHWK